MEENTATQAQEQKPTFQKLMTVPDAAIAIWFDNIDDKVADVVRRAREIVIVDDDTMKEAKEIIAESKGISKEAIDFIKPYKERVNDIKQQILDTEKRFVVPCSDNVEKPLKNAIGAYLDKKEEERREEERRRREEAEKERQKRLDKIGKGLDTLLDKVADLNERRALLEERLEDQSITVEEADEIRARIEAIDTKQRSLNTSVVERQVQMEETAAATTATVESKPKVEGMSTGKHKEPTGVTQPMVLVKAIAEGRIPIGVIKWDMTQIKRLLNAGVDVPGVTYEIKRDIRVKGA